MTTSVLLLVWIFIINIATPHITVIPQWPMYFICIFLEGANPKALPKIFASTITGVVLLLAGYLILTVIAPIIG